MKIIVKRLVSRARRGLSDLLKPRHRSETSKCRARFAKFCVGYGVDLGFGGDAINPSAIRVDFPTPYATTKGQTVQLGGDCHNLEWFRDECLDYVYSSHLLEDFEDTKAVLKEWLRVLKPGGNLIIFCPDEQVYRRHCAETGQYYNQCHKHADFSLETVKAMLKTMGQTDIIHELPLVDVYSWDLVIRKC